MGFLNGETRAALDALAALDSGTAQSGRTDASPPLERVRAVRRALRALEAEPALLAAVREARDDGVDWSQLAEAAGLSEGAAKQRWAGDDAEIADRREASRRRKRARPSSRPTELPGLSVAEAAAKLGVTPQAIYLRVSRGQLEARTVELPDGRKYKRVFPDGDEPEV